MLTCQVFFGYDHIMGDLFLSDRDLWRSFRHAAHTVNAAIESDLMAATNLSGADHGILSRLAEAEAQGMRQQALCDSMQWDRTRLSHHLTRMEGRGLVWRSKLETGGTWVGVTAAGDQARAAADPIHAEAVRRCFVSKLTEAQREAMASVLASLSASG